MVATCSSVSAPPGCTGGDWGWHCDSHKDGEPSEDAADGMTDKELEEYCDECSGAHEDAGIGIVARVRNVIMTGQDQVNQVTE